MSLPNGTVAMEIGRCDLCPPSTVGSGVPLGINCGGCGHHFHIGIGLGFSGWENRPGRGWWRFMHPYVQYGRLFSDHRPKRWSVRLRIPGWLYDRLRESTPDA